MGELRQVRGKRGLRTVGSLGVKWAAGYGGLGESLGTVGGSWLWGLGGDLWRQVPVRAMGEAGWGWFVKLEGLWGHRGLDRGCWELGSRVSPGAGLGGCVRRPGEGGGCPISCPEV